MQDLIYFRNAQDPIPEIALSSWRFRPETFHLGEIPRPHHREHRHPVYHAVLYRRADAFRYLGADTDAPAGTLALISPDEPHDFSSRRPESGEYHEVTFRLTGEAPLPSFGEFLRQLHPGAAIPAAVRRLKPESAATLERTFETTAQLIAANRTAAPVLLAALVLQLAALSPAEMAPPESNDSRLQTVRQLLELPFDREVTGDMLAAAAHLSFEHLCREFKAVYGVAPLSYRRRLRLQTARRLLLFSERTLKEIAELLGYADQYAFSRAYRQEFDEPPGRIRRRATEPET